MEVGVMTKSLRIVEQQKADGDFGSATAATRAYQAIRHRILRCRLEPGSIINERILMEEITLGRTPIREALLRLSGEGLVIFSGQSIQVAPISVASISSLYTARLHAERLAWRLWIRSADRAQITTLAATFETAELLAKAGDEEGLFDLDFQFHNQVYKECGNEFLMRHLHNLTGLTFRAWFVTNPHKFEEHLHTVRTHDPIIEAVKKRHAVGLDRAVTEHISDAFNTVMQRLKGDGFDTAAGLALRDTI
jgi:DNA-binding GntR family transcriptional regulator